MITHIHHVNFLVKDLDQAVIKYQALLGNDSGQFIFDELDARNVKIARIKLGQTWLVLVQPIGEQGIPAQHLKKHGEGFFLLSLGCTELDEQVQRIITESDLEFSSSKRQGLDNWQVQDLDTEPFGGVQIQLAEEKSE